MNPLTGSPERPPPRLRVGALLFALSAAVAAAAPRIEVKLDPERIPLHGETTLRVEVEEGRSPPLEVACEFELDNLEVVSGPHRSEGFRYNGGSGVRSETLVWRLRPLAVGEAGVHALRVRVNGRWFDLPPRRLRVAEAVGGSRPAPGVRSRAPTNPLGSFRSRSTVPKVFIEGQVEERRPWVGQQVVYLLYLYTQGDVSSISSERLPDFNGFWTREISPAKPQRVEMMDLDGERFGRVVLLRRALFPLRAGELELEPARVHLRLTLPLTGGLGQSLGTTGQRRLSSNAVALQVRPLPPPPAGFSGVVGSLRIEATLDPPVVSLGEAATYTVRLRGHGNLHALPPPELPSLPGLELLEPEQSGEVIVDDGRLESVRVWRYVVIPERRGRWQLPPVELPYFDPESASYELASSAPVLLTARPSPVDHRTAGAAHPIRSAALPVRTPFDLDRLFLYLFALPWVIAIGLVVRRSRRPERAVASPTAGRTRLLAELGEAAAEPRPAAVARAAEGAWRRYLEERFAVELDGGAERWGATLEPAGAAATALAELNRLERHLHYLRYAPQLSSSTSVRQELEDCSRRLLEELS